jgi:hypothetical protein
LPAAPLGTIVAMLRAVLNTSALAVYEVSAGRIRQRYIDPSTDTRAEQVWDQHRGELLGGTKVRAEGAVYFPIVQERVLGILEAIGVDDRQIDPFGMSMLMCAVRLIPAALECLDGAADAATAAGEAASAGSVVAGHGDPEQLMRVTLDELERQRVLTLLERHEWVVSAVARALGVDRVTVYRKMNKLGIRRAAPSPKDPRRSDGAGPLAARLACG